MIYLFVLDICLHFSIVSVFSTSKVIVFFELWWRFTLILWFWDSNTTWIPFEYCSQLRIRPSSNYFFAKIIAIAQTELPLCNGSLHSLFDCIGIFDFQSDNRPSLSYDGDLHTSSDSEHQMQRGILLNIVFAENPTVLQLLHCKIIAIGQAELPLCLGSLPSLFDCIGIFDFQSDSRPSLSYDGDLHTSLFLSIKCSVDSFWILYSLRIRPSSNYFSAK